jgi:hypothetical protein
MADEGYGEAIMTADRMADWSGGTATISFSVSTWRSTSPDWITLDVSPFEEQLALPFNFFAVELQGTPQRFIELTSRDDGGQCARLRRRRLLYHGATEILVL